MIVQVASNKSSLLLKIILQKAQTLQLFTLNIKTESIYKSYKNAKLEGFGSKGWRSIEIGDGVQALKVRVKDFAELK